MIIIDCGACIGGFFRNFTEHDIHAFEPLAKNYRYLRKRYPKVKTYRKAVTGISGEKVRLYLHEDPKHRNRLGSMGSSVHPKKSNVVSGHYEEVETIALSDFLVELNEKVDMLKIDTEGTEFEIFEDLLNHGRINDFGMILYEDHRERHPDMFDLAWTREVERRLKKEFKGRLERVDF